MSSGLAKTHHLGCFMYKARFIEPCIEKQLIPNLLKALNLSHSNLQTTTHKVPHHAKFWYDRHDSLDAIGTNKSFLQTQHMSDGTLFDFVNAQWS